MYIYTYTYINSRRMYMYIYTYTHTVFRRYLSVSQASVFDTSIIIIQMSLSDKIEREEGEKTDIAYTSISMARLTNINSRDNMLGVRNKRNIRNSETSETAARKIIIFFFCSQPSTAGLHICMTSQSHDGSICVL